MSEIKLSPKQHEIVSFEKGSILVKASAGSGKTRVLVERIKNLLKKTKRKILAITFTNKAGEEMRDRLSGISDINNRLFVGTFHGFCQKVLENHGKLNGFTTVPHLFEDEADRLKLIEQAIRQTPSYNCIYEKKDLKLQKEFSYKALNFISEAKRKLSSEEAIFKENEDLGLLYKTYQDILGSLNAIDFDDLILSTYYLFIENAKIAALYRRTYEYICIDEAQDLNHAQYQLLRSLTNDEHHNIMMVGDPNQSIFNFNGSSPKYMEEMFVEDYQPTIIELKENYRSSISVLKAAEKIIPGSCNFTDIVIPGIFEIYNAVDEKDEAKWVLEKITELINITRHADIEGDIAFEKVAVLARNKYVFKYLANLFDENNIPYYYKITPGAIKFESDLFKKFDLAFRVKLNPHDTLHWHKLLGLFPDTKADNLETLVSSLNGNIVDKKLFDTVNELNDDGSNLKSSLNVVSTFIKETSLIKDDNEKIMILNDINELLEHWQKYATTNDKKSLLQFKNAMAIGKTHPLVQKNGITLSTVHTMKGQEYDIVFLIGMDNETFPDYRAIRSGGIEMQQEKNNAYVAFTRAKRFLFVTWPEKRLMPWGDYKKREISKFLQAF